MMKNGLPLLTTLVAFGVVGCSATENTSVLTETPTPVAAPVAEDDSCDAQAWRTIQKLIETNEPRLAGVERDFIAKIELVDGHSDRELIRVTTAGVYDGRTYWGSRYLVNTESQGGSNCQVYGFQNESNPIDLTVAPDFAHMYPNQNVSNGCVAGGVTMMKAIAEINGTDLEVKHTFKPYYVNKTGDELNYIDVIIRGEDERYISYGHGNDTGCYYKALQLESQGMQMAAYENMFAKAESVIRSAASAYSIRGTDNNYLAYDVVYEISHPDHDHPALFWEDYEEVDTSSFRAIKDAFVECVFMQEGAYGRHISKSKAKDLAGWVTYELRKLSEGTPFFSIQKLNGYRVEDDIVNTSCALKIELDWYQVIVVDGHTFD